MPAAESDGGFGEFLVAFPREKHVRVCCTRCPSVVFFLSLMFMFVYEIMGLVPALHFTGGKTETWRSDLPIYSCRVCRVGMGAGTGAGL